MTGRGGRRLLLGAAALAAFAGFVALGLWQLDRRVWKHALIDRVAQRVHAAPVPAPGRADWPQVWAATHEYRRVVLRGSFDHGRETLVQAVTDLGAGAWVLTPLHRDDGSVVLVNRGFVPPHRRDPLQRAAGQPPGPVTVTGLLRTSEPGGGFLRRNAPADDRWFSRDVEAIAAARGLSAAAPYFVDADADADATTDAAAPVGGLTVVAFADNHLAYALTWFALAAGVVAAAAIVVRFERRSDQPRPS